MSRIHRKPIAIGAAIAVLALTAPAATAAKKPERDSLKGNGTTSIATVTIDAVNEGATPEAPAKGTFTAKGSGVDLKGPVTCLHVSGDSAGLIYRVEEGSSPAVAAGRDVFVTILDNGKGKDKMGFLPPGTTPPGGGCSPSIMMKMEIVDVTEGDFVVKDATVSSGF